MAVRFDLEAICELGTSMVMVDGGMEGDRDRIANVGEYEKQRVIKTYFFL